jgi:uncharacterized membrane protein
MKGFLGFLTLALLLVFGIGLVTHYKGASSIINAGTGALATIFAAELGTVPRQQRAGGH